MLTAESLQRHYGKDRWLADEAHQLVPIACAIDSCIKSSSPPKFACDSMLRPLMHKLRALDLDVVAASGSEGLPRCPLPPATCSLRTTTHERRCEEEQLAALVESGRIALTASSSTFTALQGFVYLLRGKVPDQQLREVCMVFGINAEERALEATEKRCTLCNDSILKVAKTDIIGQAPPRALHHSEQFFVCASRTCKTFFWPGNSFKEGQREIQRIVAGLCFGTSPEHHHQNDSC